MRIRLAILDQDIQYLNRIVSVFQNRYYDKLEIYSFTEEAEAYQALTSSRIDVFLASDIFEAAVSRLPSRCGFAYFVDVPDIQTINGQKAICKFQKAELIYKEVLGIFSEVNSSITGFRLNEDKNCQIHTFLSAAGGTGSSCAAAAYARYLSEQNKKVFYLNLEQFSCANIFFRGEGSYNFSDVIYALKNKKSNLKIKLDSIVQKDACGVCFYEPCKMALDITGLNEEDVKTLLLELKSHGDYDVIVVDADSSVTPVLMQILTFSHTAVIVSDGSEISEAKLERLVECFSIWDEQMQIPMLGKLKLLYNKYSSKTSTAAKYEQIPLLGGAPNFQHATTDQVVTELKKKDFWKML